jgi:hypothetical protein
LSAAFLLKSLEQVIQQQLAEPVTFTENGRERSLSKSDVILMQIVNKSAAANVRFQALLFKYVRSLDLVAASKTDLSEGTVRKDP